MRSVWTAAAVVLIVVCGGAVFAQSGAPTGDKAMSPYGVLASLDVARAERAGLAALTFPMTLPAPPSKPPLAPAMFDPHPMWPAVPSSPAAAQRADYAYAAPPIAERNVQVGAVITARY